MKITIGAKVAVGRFGSCVGMWTIVAEGLMVGVIEAVGVMLGVRVMVAVFVAGGMDVGWGGPKNGTPAHACKNKVNASVKWSLRILNLFHAAVLCAVSTHFTTS
jgi:hypothetical protein